MFSCRLSVYRWLAWAARALTGGGFLFGAWLATAALWRGGSHGATYTAAQADLGGLVLLGALACSALARRLAPRSEPEASAPEDAAPMRGGEPG